MATEPINIPIQTSYDDKGAKEALQDVEKLDKADPTVEVDADVSSATDDIDTVTQSAQDLIDRNPWIAEVLSDTAAAKGDLESLQSKLRDTGETADDTGDHFDKIGRGGGPQVGVQSLSDMLGPLGDVSGQASEAGQAVEGIGQFAEAAAAKVGIESAAMSSAIGGIGIAVGIAAAVWSVFKAKQEEARKKTAEHLKIQGELLDAIKEGNREAASKKFLELYGDIIDKGHEAGLSTNEVVDAIRGTGDAADTAQAKIDTLDTRLVDLRDAYDKLHATTAASGAVPSGEEKALADQIVSLGHQRDALIDAQTEYGDLSTKQQESVDLQGDVQDALFGTTDKLDDTAAAAQRAKEKADDLSAAFDTLRGNMDVTRESQDLTSALLTAMDNVNTGVGNTRDEIRTIEDTVIQVAEATGRTPIEVKTELEKLNQGDMAGVLADTQAWFNQHQIQVHAQLASDTLANIRNTLNKLPGINLTGLSAGGQSATAGRAQTVNVNLPRGARTGDIARAMGLSTRRNGRRYGNPSGTVTYARR